MHTELSNLREHLDRYRAVTLLTLDAVPSDDALAWRPAPGSFTLGQQLAHVAQTEDYYTGGLFGGGAWRQELLRFDAAPAGRDALRAHFVEVRARFAAHLDALTDTALGETRDAPHAPQPLTLRWWLWFLLEHEIHHKAQAAVYLRMLGREAPFYAAPMPLGTRPDVDVRESLGGV